MGFGSFGSESLIERDAAAVRVVLFAGFKDGYSEVRSEVIVGLAIRKDECVKVIVE